MYCSTQRLALLWFQPISRSLSTDTFACLLYEDDSTRPSEQGNQHVTNKLLNIVSTNKKIFTKSDDHQTKVAAVQKTRNLESVSSSDVRKSAFLNTTVLQSQLLRERLQMIVKAPGV